MEVIVEPVITLDAATRAESKEVSYEVKIVDSDLEFTSRAKAERQARALRKAIVDHCE